MVTAINKNTFLFIFEYQESVVQGSMLIVHKLHEGKHQYEVENVVKYKKTSGEKAFARYSSHTD